VVCVAESSGGGAAAAAAAAAAAVALRLSRHTVGSSSAGRIQIRFGTFVEDSFVFPPGMTMKGAALDPSSTCYLLHCKL
jgi:hypothetical protein